MRGFLSVGIVSYPRAELQLEIQHKDSPRPTKYVLAKPRLKKSQMSCVFQTNLHMSYIVVYQMFCVCCIPSIATLMCIQLE